MENKIARIISYIFHPLLMPVYTFSFLFSTKTFFASILTLKGKILILIFIFISTFILPAIFTYFLFRLNKISSLHLEKREDRIIPFLVTIIFYYTTYLMMKNTIVPAIYLLIMLAATLMIILAFFINFKFKISIHSMSIGALTGILIGISYLYAIDLFFSVIILIITGGLVGFSRLVLNAHRPIEVYCGYLMGLGFMLGLLILAK
jgi:hypothetical protein